MTITERRRAYILKVLREHRGSYLGTYEIRDILINPQSKVHSFDVLEVLHGLHRDGLVSRLDKVHRTSGKAYGWAVPHV